jgi:hypothetical protein
MTNGLAVIDLVKLRGEVEKVLEKGGDVGDVQLPGFNRPLKSLNGSSMSPTSVAGARHSAASSASNGDWSTKPTPTPTSTPAPKPAEKTRERPGAASRVKVIRVVSDDSDEDSAGEAEERRDEGDAGRSAEAT